MSIRTSLITVVVGILIAYLWILISNGFVHPDLMIGPKDHVHAKIDTIKRAMPGKGLTYQAVFYHYEIEGIRYEDYFHAGERWGGIHSKDELNVKYQISNPSKNKVVGVFRK